MQSAGFSSIYRSPLDATSGTRALCVPAEGNLKGTTQITQFSFLMSSGPKIMLRLSVICNQRNRPSPNYITYFIRTIRTSSLGSGTRGSVVVEALCYNPKCRKFESRWGELFYFNLLNPSSRTRPLSRMSIRNGKIMFLWNVGRPVHKVDNPAAICEPIVYTMWDP
jgi:hypothetical protein